ncbi:GMC oxidoreductase [Dyella soli]|uniref:GMC family oxidoreductase n=1 Tax=Dyella soli TaxID=522319 RepID=A0A4R0YVR7_9GAMM|nr:GMC oxidoreductase [Dyella soli]TCI10440.1 GMC family oxidoreductase [Dyella soli]
MIIDYLSGAYPAEVEADLCIIGAGAAGIAIAREFIGSHVTVCLVEGGGFTGEQRSQELYEGSSVGHVPFDPGTSRMRVFGGSCNLWGGGCIPLSRQDMSARDWVPHSGWPITYNELVPYYARAKTYCHLHSHDFVDGSFATPTFHQPIAFNEETLVNQVFVHSPILFGDTYRDELEQAANITVLLHANVLELMASPDGRSVRSARLGSLDGHRGSVRARQYVLACGGIENARLMLLSDSVVPQGLGNQHDVVGRYFMDHPSGTLGRLSTKAPHRVTRPYDRRRYRGATPSFPEIGLSDRAQRAHRVLNGRMHPFGVEGPLPRGIRALRELRAALRPAPRDENALLEEQMSAALRNAPAVEAVAVPGSLGLAALRVGLGVGDLARAFVHKLADRPTVASSHIDLVGYFEQAPNPDSRITLGHDTDAFGQRKVSVDWRLTSLDHHTYRAAASLFGSGLAHACQGHFQLDPWLSDDIAVTPLIHGTAHHLGTTRMSDDPRTGVVDRNCKVHGMDNLYLAGSSVFPTGGWAFPTFTIVALSLRLADQLRTLLTPYVSSGLM